MSDGKVWGVYTIHEAGPMEERYNLAILSEGYTLYQLNQFIIDAKTFTDRLFSTPPFDALRCSINVFRIDVSSTQSGADDPNFPGYCNGTGIMPATFFDATFCAWGIERLLWVDKMTVETVLAYYLPEAHAAVMLVNAAKEGGSGDTYATVSKGSGWDWPKVALHELGHVFGLGDEYDYRTACDDGNTKYAGPPPTEWANVAQDISRDGLKWGHLVDASTPLPTFTNPDQSCKKCYTGNTGYPDTVGAFEGAGLYHCGLYRPQEDCLMRYADDFCVVCSDAIMTEMVQHQPVCLAPVFEPKSGFYCYFMKFFLMLWATVLSVVAFHPRGDCAYRKAAFRAQHCGVGNSNACLDLGGTGSAPTRTIKAIPYPYPNDE